MNFSGAAPESGSEELSPRPEVRKAADTSTGTTRAPFRIFLVEDSPHVRDLLLDILHVPGAMEIVGYADAEDDAVSAILAHPVDAVIVDLKLRAGGGMSVIKRLREAKLRPEPTLIVFTNHPLPEIKARALKLGADYFFDKSADYESVQATLRALQAR